MGFTSKNIAFEAFRVAQATDECKNRLESKLWEENYL